MKNRLFFTVAFGVLFLISMKTLANEDTLAVKVGENGLISYQAIPMTNSKGGSKFLGSDFIHPLKTPSGFVVTGMQPDDHLHHFGLWWPWKYIEVDGRKILCWELQKGDGIIQAQGGQITADGFSSKSIYVDRKCSTGHRTVLNETLKTKVSKIIEKPVKGYNLDLEIIHESAGKKVTVTKYRYSGFCLRGTPAWNKSTCSVVTSAGKTYAESNFTRAKWVKIEGDANNGNKAGILMMSHPENRDHPELLRTWNPKMQDGAVFVNFNTVQETPWEFLPGKKYIRNFRVFVYDGSMTTEDAEKMWQSYSSD